MEIPTPHESEEPLDAARQSVADELGLSPLGGDEGLARVVQLLARIGEAPMAAFWVVDQGRQFLAADHGLANVEVTQRSALAEQTLRQDEVLTVADATQDLRFSSDSMVVGAPQLRFFAGIAIRGRLRERIGLLCLMDTAPRAVGEHVRSALLDLRVIVEDRLRLRSDVLHDPQTGTLTRRHFDRIADREWRRAMRALAPISLIVTELDRAREFAAREGAGALDRGLRASALAMQYSLHRPGDCVCRYDDSRFAMLLPGTDEHGAAETAERVRHAVEALRIPFPDAGPLTLSAGVCTVHSESLSRTDLPGSMRAATGALRSAQRAGGNRWMQANASGERFAPL